MSGIASTLDLQVRSVRALARDILGIELAAADGRPLPGAQAGAHIDLHLPNGLIRQYSLTHTPGTATQASYQVAVGLDAHSRGGSSWIHDKLRVGTTLRVSAPRNLFALDPAHRRILLVAGGIGITPIYAMAQAAARAGLDWQLVACARSLARLAFTEELRALLQKWKLEEEAACLAAHGVLDLEDLKYMTEDDVVTFGLPLKFRGLVQQVRDG